MCAYIKSPAEAFRPPIEKHRLLLPTKGMTALFKHEIIGQLSDGMWENTSPAGHWRFWNNLDTDVSQVGRYEFLPSRNGTHPDRVTYRLTRLATEVGDTLRTTVVGGELGLDAAFVKELEFDRPPALASSSAIVMRPVFKAAFKAYRVQDLMDDLRGLQQFMAHIVDNCHVLRPLNQPYHRTLQCPAAPDLAVTPVTLVTAGFSLGI